MIAFLTSLIDSVSAVVQAAIAAAAGVYVASTWWRTKALVPTLTSIMLAVVVVWAAGHVDVLEGRVDADLDQWMQEVPQ